MGPGAGFCADLAGNESAPEQQALRHEGSGPTWIPSPALIRPANLVLPGQTQAKAPELLARARPMGPGLPSGKRRLLARYDPERIRQVWYAVAAISAKAIAYVPGRAQQTSGLYIQKRAKLEGGQLGLARDVGAAQVTLGYLYTRHGRAELVPYVKGAGRQDYAALTFTLKR